MRSKKIVITGGAGFCGSNFIKYILNYEKNIEIISIDDYSTGLKKNHVNSKKIKYLKGNTSNINKLLKNYKKIDTVFHFAEFSRIVQSFENYERCFQSNINGTLEVIKYCSVNKIRLIYSASSSRFGNNGRDEHLSPYSWSKSKNIELIKNFNKWFNLNYTIVYFYNVYGDGQIKKHSMAACIGIFEEQFVNNKPLTVVSPGTQKRDFTHISDICRGTYLAWKKNVIEEFLLGTQKNYSINQVAKMFKSKIKYIPERRGERLKSVSYNDKAKKILGYTAKVDLKKYIKNFIENNPKAK